MDSRKLSHRAEAQWVTMFIKNTTLSSLTIKNVDLEWGKFYADGNKSQEIPLKDIEGKTIAPKKSITINACGRESAASGTEGSFNIFSGGDKVCHIYWDVPWGSSTNTFTISDTSDDWVVGQKGANLSGGALGTVTVTVVQVS